MSTTNWLFYTNFAIFSVFLTLFITELMGAFLLLFAYERTRTRVLTHVVPIWEVTGTFAAFWVVTADFAYPSMLIPVASLLAGYIVVFLIFLVARNASISYAEYIIKRRWLDEKKLYQAYAVSTLLIGVVVVLILSAIVSGAGVDLATLTFSLAGWLTNPGSLPYLAGVLVIGIGLAPVFYGIDELRRWTLPVTVTGVVVEAAALGLYARSFLAVWFLVPALLTILPAVLYQVPRTATIGTNKVVFGAVGCLIIFSQSYLVYPTAFHGGVDVDTVTTTGPMVTAFLALSAAGLVIVGLLMVLYMVVAGRPGRRHQPSAGSASRSAGRVG
jgi:cytochrome bd ubiquinol oxidase subunit II